MTGVRYVQLRMPAAIGRHSNIGVLAGASCLSPRMAGKPPRGSIDGQLLHGVWLAAGNTELLRQPRFPGERTVEVGGDERAPEVGEEHADHEQDNAEGG